MILRIVVLVYGSSSLYSLINMAIYVTFYDHLGNKKEYLEDVHIYPMSMALLSLGKHAKLSKYCQNTIHNSFYHQQ